ncbi:hypothetical protein [Luteirhabdus pelagi]|uniref:hypothetical protein n=1 Tax=Luteirhabdus pelagi TaxID=2792783 RepID=UPI00193A7C51|nr:hypothetical protein [Luteirhabdus pelagi]
MENNIKYIAKAFISCSLRREDEKFVDFVSNILHYHQILPFGTVGLHDASTDNPVTLMKDNIEKSDFVVVIATPRYFSRDNNNGKSSNTISEMIHTETGMAFANSKPVVVFVQEGTNVGTFIPSITQYISLDGTQRNLDSQLNLIRSLLNNAYQKAEEIKRQNSWRDLGRIAIGALAIYGGLKFFEYDGYYESEYHGEQSE